MGFHCGNTPSCKLCADRAVKYQLIQHRLLEPAGSEPDFTRGTSRRILRQAILRSIASSAIPTVCFAATLQRVKFCRYIRAASAASASSPSRRWGASTAMCSSRKRYPHHGAVAFGHYGKLLFEAFQFLGVADIAYNQPKSLPYPTENPFA